MHSKEMSRDVIHADTEFISEVTSPQKDSVIIESYVSPKIADMPVIVVAENRETGSYSALFELSLSGVRRNGKRNGHNDTENKQKNIEWDRYTHSLLDGMSDDQEVQVIYKGGRKQDGSVFLDWSLRGISRAETREGAINEAKRLYQGISVVLKTAEEVYTLMPVTNTEEIVEFSPERGWIAFIEPASITIKCSQGTSIGFENSVDSTFSTAGVVLPVNNPKKAVQHFDSIAAGVKGSPVPLACVISMKPVQLKNDELTKIKTIFRALQQNKAEVIKTGKKIDQRFAEKAFLTGLGNKLQAWLDHPRGLRVGCMVVSPSQIPMPLLTMIGGEVFHGSPFSVKELHDDPKSDRRKKASPQMTQDENEEIIDMRGCLNGSLIVPPLFPKTSLLLQCGVEKRYSKAYLPENTDGIMLGFAGNSGDRREVRIVAGDRSRHYYIVGSTGVGKSTLLFNMIRQDIRDGQGIVLVEPHGDLYHQVLEEAIPPGRLDDVILIDPCDFGYSVGINFLECSNSPFRGVEVNYVVNEMIKIFDRLYDLRQTGGPIFEQYMRNALLLLLENESWTATLIDVPRIFEEKSFRRFLLKTCTNPLVVNFWRKQAEAADGDASLNNIAPYITSKLNQFVTNAVMRPIIGQPKSSINFREALDTGRIILVNLSKGLLGELDAQLLGMLIIGKLFSSAMGRVTMTQQQRRPVYLYVDEFQNFTTDSVAFMISEARKFGLNLILANQNLSQLSANTGKQNILDSVLGNVGNVLVFRLGVIDSQRLEAYTRPELMEDDLQELPDFHLAARILMQNKPQRPFVFTTLPASHDQDICSAESVIAGSRARYAVEMRIVEDNIRKRFERDSSESEGS